MLHKMVEHREPSPVLQIVCANFDYDPEQIGEHMMEMLAKFRNEGIVG